MIILLGPFSGGLRRRLLVAAVVAPTFCLLSAAGGADAAAQLSSKTLVKCQKGLNKAAQNLSEAKLSGALGCAEALLACQLAEELESADFAACAAKANGKCVAKLGTLDKSVAKLTQTLDKKCAELEQGSLALNLVGSRGLGYRAASDACASLSPPAEVGDLAAVADCIERASLCRADDAIEQLLPRAYEVLDRAGVLAAYAESFPCLDTRAPSPASPGPSAKDLIGCQKTMHKEGQKRLKTAQKSTYGCADSLLSCQAAVDRLEATISEGAACAANAANKCDALLGKVDDIAGKAASKIASKCVVGASDVLGALGFSATCASATTIAEVADCAEQASDASVQGLIGTVEPRTCSLLDAAEKLTGWESVCVPFCGNADVEDGETCDDGNADDFDGCRNDCTPGPTDFEFVAIPSGAAPAETPDGTAGTAVDPGSTLATQFGATTFDLNQAIYTRLFVPGAGDPDAVLILIPGFAGGSGSFKYLAENLLARAQTNGNIVLEVWAFDRRTNLLEDDEGAVLADAENDAKLAIDWYFGAEMGLALDARLTRRAVFHDGPDVAFIANWTPNVHARDIDAVVEAARALPGPPAVFLGGHSLGTTFTARYAATDFDTGAGVLAGYSKLDGLVLLEGGGDSVPTTPPTDDALDLAIAKADGGLFQAVKNQDGRCVDGTPCDTICIGGPDDGAPCDPLGANTCDSPGVCGGDDSDCAAVVLPPGALTNKCVPPVEAYTGDNLNGPLVLVTPEVHAAGDIVGIQGKQDPDGLNMLQQDFGGGSAVQVVPGLGILDVLPPSSAETAVGFFLDDDFSPVSAFQASLGYSNNGLNLPFLGGIILPQDAYPPDPYRLWIGIDEPMPAEAVPNNGAAPSTANDTWGDEKEVSRVDVMFSFLRASERNFGDSYFGSSGLSTTAGLSGGGTFGGGLDSSALSVGRSRPDIENLTQAALIDIPVIAFGGTNGLTPTTASFEGFAKSIAKCAAATCDGSTDRVVGEPNDATTLYGGVAGGFEVHLSEGYAHIDVVSAEDDADNQVVVPLLDFLERNTP